MAMRDLVSGGAACSVPGSSSSSNPLGALANTLLGSSSKTQERLKEIPTSTSSGSGGQFHSSYDGQLTALPGSEFDQQFSLQPSGQDFLHNFRAASHGGLAEAWDDIHHPQRESSIPESRHIYDQGFMSQSQQSWDGPPQQILSSFLHSFVDSSRVGAPFRPTTLPMLGLTEGDKQCIRNRSSIMARHIFVDKSEDFINAQIDALLCSLDIDKDTQIKGHLPGRVRELDQYWNESQRMLPPVAPAADEWANEYSQRSAEHFSPNGWVNSFEKQYGPGGWASEFEHEQRQIASLNQSSGQHMTNLAAMEQTRMLAHTLGQNNDPKFQVSRSGDKWVNEFTAGNKYEVASADTWVDDFSKLNVQDWAEEFGNQADSAAWDESTDSWAASYDEYLNEQSTAKHNAGSSKGVYEFSDMNPYVGHPDPLKEGQELFRKGLLSEAVLALEAEVLKNPDNAEGWRLLGIAHAENDDDQQAIASMMKAQQVDPANLEVLLALGVSHTNELEQSAALKYLYQWLHNHPRYGTLASVEPSDSLYYADVARIFNDAAQMSPEDADVHIVLGVLYNLSREYNKAIDSFKTALKLKPQDYSLWNKLGATQANSVQSADALEAYQQALDLKPNYVRAWANMGISYANQVRTGSPAFQLIWGRSTLISLALRASAPLNHPSCLASRQSGMYEESIRFYVRALAMNPKADNAWQYLRISLSCASRNDMLEACDSRNIDVLQKEFPL
ncbi:hypothetical protein KSS87_003213 [Heliosperma pusillum]|nr:hypothetical protein KSS87_003213 [Heliosperma pusillum]